jgi:predicted DsbA family dithiol-disulfide isomerase
MTALPPTIEFFFDPACPWTWMTSRWLVDAATRTDIQIEWRNLSLSVVNADRVIPEQYRAPLEAARGAHRIIAALRGDAHNGVVGDFYTE